MKLTIDDKALYSVHCWLDNLIVNTLDGYKTFQESFYYSLDERYGVSSFASRRKQWVYDNQKAYIPSGAYVNGVFKSFDDTFFPDFDNGRILQTTLSQGDIVSGQYSCKEVNNYLYNDAERDIVLDQNLSQISFSDTVHTGVEPYVLQLPALFPMLSITSSKPLQLGDTDNKYHYIGVRIVGFFDQNVEQNQVSSAIRSYENKYIKLVEPEFTPLNEYGNLKSNFFGSYSYQSLPENYDIFIENVKTSQIYYKQKNLLNRNLKYSIIDMKLMYIGKTV